MKKLKKISSLFTAIFISISLFLVGPAGLTLNRTEIRAEIEKLNIQYQNAERNALKDHPGWLNLFTDVLTYAQATEADVKISPRPENRQDNWADYIARDGGFTAISGEGDVVERSNIQAMLANFNHNERFFQSNWRIKNDYHLLQDWGALYYTVEHKNGQVKPYRAIVYDSNDDSQNDHHTYGRFGNKIREIYNLDPDLNANRHDMLCLRAVFRAIKALDEDVDDNLTEMLDRFFTSGAYQKLIRLLANDNNVKNLLGLHEDFSSGNMQNPRTNPALSYKAISKFIISAYYNWDNVYASDDIMVTKNGTKYQIVCDPQSGYVSNIIKTRSDWAPRTLEITEKNQNSAPTTAVFVTMSPEPNKNLDESSPPPKNSTNSFGDDDDPENSTSSFEDDDDPENSASSFEDDDDPENSTSSFEDDDNKDYITHIVLLLVSLGILIMLAAGLGYIVIIHRKKTH